MLVQHLLELLAGLSPGPQMKWYAVATIDQSNAQSGASKRGMTGCSGNRVESTLEQIRVSLVANLGSL